jgi:hypothetical protein
MVHAIGNQNYYKHFIICWSLHTVGAVEFMPSCLCYSCLVVTRNKMIELHHTLILITGHVHIKRKKGQTILKNPVVKLDTNL